jgi:hypothetical protein
MASQLPSDGFNPVYNGMRSRGLISAGIRGHRRVDSGSCRALASTKGGFCEKGVMLEQGRPIESLKFDGLSEGSEG